MTRAGYLLLALLVGCDPNCSSEKCREAGGVPLYDCERDVLCAPTSDFEVKGAVPAEQMECRPIVTCGVMVKCDLPPEKP